MSVNVKVTPTGDGAVITVNGVEVTVTVRAKPSVPAAAPAAPTLQVQEGRRVAVETVKARLAAFLSELTVTEEAEGIVVRPTGYLGRDKFTSIAATVRGLGGRYVSAGRESRFVIPVE